MARYTDAVCRLCRREGQKLFLKGERCLSKKCSIDVRNYAPGQHGQRRAKETDYGIQLREKQKVKRMYGLLERQFRNYYFKASGMQGVTGTNLLILLETRLDSIVYRSGFASSRAQARQLVTHGHFLVNGKPVNIPSYQLRVNDTVEVREKSRELTPIQNAIGGSRHERIPAWLEVVREEFKAAYRSSPTREEIPVQANEQLIIELYSK